MFGAIMPSEVFGISEASVALGALVLVYLLFIVLDLVVTRVLLVRAHARSFREGTRLTSDQICLGNIFYRYRKQIVRRERLSWHLLSSEDYLACRQYPQEHTVWSGPGTD